MGGSSTLVDLGLWLALVLPSLMIVDRFAGSRGVAIYALVAAVGVHWRGMLERVSPRIARLGIATVAVVFVVAFAVVYPRVNVHTAHAGSDDDDAHDIGAIALLHK